MPPPLVALVANLWAVHTNEYDYIKDFAEVHAESPQPDQDTVRQYREEFVSDVYQTEHRWYGSTPRQAVRSCCSVTS